MENGIGSRIIIERASPRGHPHGRIVLGLYLERTTRHAEALRFWVQSFWYCHRRRCPADANAIFPMTVCRSSSICLVTTLPTAAKMEALTKSICEESSWVCGTATRSLTADTEERAGVVIRLGGFTG